jgi:Ca2+:H+ antiporter
MSANNKQPFIESSPEEKDKMSGTTPKKYNFVAGAFEVVVKGPFNILFLAIPVAFICQGVNAPAGATFIFSLVGIAPLAERLGYITEQLAMHTNDTIGGLLNVTFGNATELIVAATALFRGFYRVVQLTLIGSVLSNLLLVLGSAFLVGGIKFEMQYFGRLSAENNTPLLLVTAMSLIFPTALSTSGSISTTGLLSVSRCASLVMLILYVLFLYFQV